uniref:Uncharacterized protein n=1 Tax=Anopheles quadriannulatus TaxID=34691 RepID=A0A182WRM7_ANOQN
MAHCVKLVMLFKVLLLSCCFAHPTNQQQTSDPPITENVQCLIELKELLKFVFKLLSVESFDLLSEMNQFDKMQHQESFSSASSSKSAENNHDNTEQPIHFLLEKLDMLMRNFNQTVGTLSCFKQTRFNRETASHVANLRQQSTINCDTSPMVCMVFRLLHWMYVEPTYEIIQLLRFWIRGNKSFQQW